MGFQKRTAPEHFKQVGLAIVKYTEGGPVCSCGWVTKPAREKVMEDRIDRHFAKRHNGKGIRL